MRDIVPTISKTTFEQRDEWDTKAVYDSWESICDIIHSSGLTPEEQTLLYCLSIFGCCPIPVTFVTSLSMVITMSSGRSHLTANLLRSLIKKCFVFTYPSPVVMHPSLSSSKDVLEEEFVYMPQYLASYLWKSLDDRDRVFALAASYRTLSRLPPRPHYVQFLLGLAAVLMDAVQLHSDLIEEDCFKEIYRGICSLYLNLLQQPLHSTSS